ncbi:hypothetical protein BESB_046850 [Besnoitia besnoiti]|uniref:Uncharacterized protein n=1 Tax=Besnoitia besnoiti TaxID=94643 RepID=A0A2A9MLC5_BESBE|nr:hypothetical protein BESB_046850 [Besnoitia besnoiti]PFH36493.1 hypothetical protein BESB_046850 [Besnoitia besnoiti]
MQPVFDEGRKVAAECSAESPSAVSVELTALHVSEGDKSNMVGTKRPSEGGGDRATDNGSCQVHPSSYGPRWFFHRVASIISGRASIYSSSSASPRDDSVTRGFCSSSKSPARESAASSLSPSSETASSAHAISTRRDPVLLGVAVGSTAWWFWRSVRTVEREVGRRYADIAYQIRRPDALSNRIVAFKYLVGGGVAVPLLALGACVAFSLKNDSPSLSTANRHSGAAPELLVPVEGDDDASRGVSAASTERVPALHMLPTSWGVVLREQLQQFSHGFRDFALAVMPQQEMQVSRLLIKIISSHGQTRKTPLFHVQMFSVQPTDDKWAGAVHAGGSDSWLFSFVNSGFGVLGGMIFSGCLRYAPSPGKQPASSWTTACSETNKLNMSETALQPAIFLLLCGTSPCETLNSTDFSVHILERDRRFRRMLAGAGQIQSHALRYRLAASFMVDEDDFVTAALGQGGPDSAIRLRHFDAMKQHGERKLQQLIRLQEEAIRLASLTVFVTTPGSCEEGGAADEPALSCLQIRPAFAQLPFEDRGACLSVSPDKMQSVRKDGEDGLGYEQTWRGTASKQSRGSRPLNEAPIFASGHGDLGCVPRHHQSKLSLAGVVAPETAQHALREVDAPPMNTRAIESGLRGRLQKDARSGDETTDEYASPVGKNTPLSHPRNADNVALLVMAMTQLSKAGAAVTGSVRDPLGERRASDAFARRGEASGRAEGRYSGVGGRQTEAARSCGSGIPGEDPNSGCMRAIPTIDRRKDKHRREHKHSQSVSPTQYRGATSDAAGCLLQRPCCCDGFFAKFRKRTESSRFRGGAGKSVEEALAMESLVEESLVVAPCVKRDGRSFRFDSFSRHTLSFGPPSPSLARRMLLSLKRQSSAPAHLSFTSSPPKIPTEAEAAAALLRQPIRFLLCIFPTEREATDTRSLFQGASSQAQVKACQSCRVSAGCRGSDGCRAACENQRKPQGDLSKDALAAWGWTHAVPTSPWSPVALLAVGKLETWSAATLACFNSKNKHMIALSVPLYEVSSHSARSSSRDSSPRRPDTHANWKAVARLGREVRSGTTKSQGTTTPHKAAAGMAGGQATLRRKTRKREPVCGEMDSHARQTEPAGMLHVEIACTGEGAGDDTSGDRLTLGESRRRATDRGINSGGRKMQILSESPLSADADAPKSRQSFKVEKGSEGARTEGRTAGRATVKARREAQSTLKRTKMQKRERASGSTKFAFAVASKDCIPGGSSSEEESRDDDHDPYTLLSAVPLTQHAAPSPGREERAASAPMSLPSSCSHAILPPCRSPYSR